MKKTLILSIAATALCLTVSGCHKKIASAKPPAPPPAPITTAPTPSPEARTPEPSRPVVAETSTPSRMPDAKTKARIQELLDRIQDAYFDYNQHSLRPDAETALKQDVQTLSEIIRQYPDFRLTIEGYCDERGSDEYNLALGEARAKQAKEYMSSLGLPGQQLKTVSYGREKPICTEHDEACWQKNRRAHITQAQ